MARKKISPQTLNVGEMMPDEVGAVKALVQEFMGRVTNIDNEIELLKGDRKELIEEYSEKLDVKTLNQALKIVRIQNEIVHRDAFDLFMEALVGEEK